MSASSVLKKISSPYTVIQTTHSPYSTSTAIEAIEAAFAATNIGQKVVYVFVGDGVYQLANNQQNSLISHKSIFKKICALPLFDVELIFAQKRAIKQANVNLNEVPININMIDNEELIALCADAHQVLVF